MLLTAEHMAYFTSKNKLKIVNAYSIVFTGVVNKLTYNSGNEYDSVVITSNSDINMYIKPKSEWKKTHPEYFI